jgi:release factor glutamine methyltransferase
LKDLLRSAFIQFEKNKISPIDAELLLAYLLGVSRKEIHSQGLDIPTEKIEAISTEYAELINQRLLGRPVQYITGRAPFRYLELEVGEGVLIPRPETEVLVDRAIGFLSMLNADPKAKSVIDLGAGSGAISIAIASECAIKGLEVSVIAVEKSKVAAEWLNKNIAKYELPIRVVIEDVEHALADVKADLVVANPPYIPDDEILPLEVEGFEPQEALRGGPGDGMHVPKKFISAASRLLKPGGILIIEHHENQTSAINDELRTDFYSYQVHADLTGRDRFTSARRR